MSAPPSLAPQVHLHELCLLVHGFLRKYVVTFPETFAAFRRESAAFRDGVSAGGKVKTLESVMNEFLELKHARQVRHARRGRQARQVRRTQQPCRAQEESLRPRNPAALSQRRPASWPARPPTRKARWS